MLSVESWRGEVNNGGMEKVKSLFGRREMEEQEGLGDGGRLTVGEGEEEGGGERKVGMV